MSSSHPVVRLVRVEDADALVAALSASRDHLADAFPSGSWVQRLDPDLQRERIAGALRGHAAGTRWPGVIVADGGQLLGRVAVEDIVLANRRTGSLSYWLRADATGQGHATRAVAAVLQLAFGALGLHRVEAFVRPANTASLGVLERCGFERIGVARRHTFVGTDWQDEVLLQRLAPWDAPGVAEPLLS